MIHRRPRPAVTVHRCGPEPAPRPDNGHAPRHEHRPRRRPPRRRSPRRAGAAAAGDAIETRDGERALELAAEQLLAQNIVPAKAADVVPSSIRSLAVIAEPRLDPLGWVDDMPTRTAAADVVLDNSGTLQQLQTQVDELMEKLTARAAARA